MHKVDILLATYNGEKHLSAQIASLFEQTFNDWRLLVRDDGSTDATVSIIQSLVLEHPDKVVFIEDELGNLGPSQSFSKLMTHSSAPYVAFCDQDDVWMQDKLELQLQEMIKTEKKSGPDTPVLIHTDLKVVGASMMEWSDSFWQYQNIKPAKMNKLNILLLQNYVTGCTCLLNRSLVNEASPIPDQAIMHDWWIALVALSKGEIVEIERASIYYRQHGSNDIGAKFWGIMFIVNKILADPDLIKISLKRTRDQAIALYQMPGLNDDHKATIQRYINLYDYPWIARRVALIKNKFYKYGLIRKIALFLMV